MHTMVLKRLLEKMGFAHVSGWVHKSDAPKIRAKIAAAEKEVAAVKLNIAETEGATRAGDSATRQAKAVDMKAKK